MNKLFLLFLFFISLPPLKASEVWGPTGHRTVGEIAEGYLAPEVKEKISELLKGQSLALVSTFADEIKSDMKYWAYNPWHYVNFPFDGTYEDHPKSEKGDIVQAIYTCIEVLKNTEASKEQKAFHLKLLIHFVGDIHQPLHVGIADDLGGNKFQVRWFGEGTNLHRVWDVSIIEKFGMSYSELAKNQSVLTEAEVENIMNSKVEDWMYESRDWCLDIYENTTIGDKLSYAYTYKYTTIVRSQLQKGGIRLAGLLNEIFTD